MRYQYAIICVCNFKETMLSTRLNYKHGLIYHARLLRSNHYASMRNVRTISWTPGQYGGRWWAGSVAMEWEGFELYLLFQFGEMT